MSRNITIRKIMMGSQEDIDSNAGFVDGTPQYRWTFTKHYADFSKPLRKDVVNIIRN